MQVDLMLCLSLTLFKCGVVLLCCHASLPSEMPYDGLIQVFIFTESGVGWNSKGERVSVCFSGQVDGFRDGTRNERLGSRHHFDVSVSSKY